MNLTMKKLRFLIEYIFLSILFLVLSLLPINLVSRIGGYILKIFGPISKAHKTALRNYKKVFTDVSNDKINYGVRKSWENLGKTLFELSILEKIVDKKNNMITVKGLENIKGAIQKNERVIFFGIHQSNWEILVPTIDQLGINIGAIYRHINNRYINEMILRKRKLTIKRDKSFYTPKGKESAKDILTALNNNLSIILLIDQKDSAGDNVNLFNNLVKTQTGFLKIARKHNIKLIPIKNTRYNNNNFIINFCKPLRPFDKNSSDIEAMQKIHKIVENWIIENPNQWFWQHNRFN